MTTEYQKLLASAKIGFDGKELNLSTITTYLQDLDRTVRKSLEKMRRLFLRSMRKNWMKFMISWSKTETNKRVNWAMPIMCSWDMTVWDRNCYRASDVKVFREQIIRDLVPVTVTIRKMQAQRIGVDEIKLHDTGVSFTDGNQSPTAKHRNWCPRHKNV